MLIYSLLAKYLLYSCNSIAIFMRYGPIMQAIDSRLSDLEYAHDYLWFFEGFDGNFIRTPLTK